MTADPASVIVDAHVHVFRPATVIPRGVDRLAPAQRDAPVEDLLSVMTAHSVAAAVLVPLDESDDYVAQVLAEHPGRFAAVAVAGPALHGRTQAPPLEVLCRRRDGFGFGAVRTQWLGEPGRPIRDSPFLPVLRSMARDGLVLWTYLPPDQLPLLDELAAELPDLVIVLNHLGFCPHDMRVDEHARPAFDNPFPESTLDELRRLSRHRGVHVMLSGQYALSTEPPPYRDLDAVIREIADRYGASRMLWASDYPWTRDVPGYPTLLTLARYALPDASEAELADIHGATALRLFPTLQPAKDH